MVLIISFFDVSETVKLVFLVVIPAILYFDYRWIQHDKPSDSFFPSAMMFLILECLFCIQKYPLVLNSDEMKLFLICSVFSTGLCCYYVYKHRNFLMANLKGKYGERLPALKWFFLGLVFIAVCAVVTFPLMANLLLANAWLDRSPVQQRQIVVAELYKSTSRHGTYYSIYYPSWSDPSDREKIDVNRDFYYSKKNGDKVFLETKAGFFGWEWLVDYR